MIQLRRYQLEDFAALRRAFITGYRSVCYQLPTGGGKSVVFAALMQAAAARGTRVCLLVHRRELLRQGSAHLTEWEVPHGTIAPGHPQTGHLVQVASVQTLVRRLHRGYEFDLLVADEGHHCVAGTWKRIMQAYPAAHVLGVTATPCRLSGEGLATVFDHLHCGPSVRELTEQGFLSPAKVYAPALPMDTSGLRSRGGDYRREDVDDLVNRRAIIGDAVAHYRRHCNGVPAVAFCASVAHAEAVAAAFQAEGFRATSVDGQMDIQARDAAIAGLGAGRLNVLTSCEIISEGVDIPVVSAAILMRPTKSLTIYLQQVGRALRPYPGKTHAVILDHVGNVFRHGLPEQDRVWTLEEGAVKDDSDATIPRVRQCPRCYLTHDYTPQCPDCGYVYPPPEREAPHQADGELEEVDPAVIEKLWKQAQSSGQLKDYHAWAKASGRKPGQAWFNWKRRRAGRRLEGMT